MPALPGVINPPQLPSRSDALRPIADRSTQTMPVPMLGETQFQFFDRAMQALQNRIPSTNRRALAVLHAWSESGSDRDLIEKARVQFPADQFRHSSPRCVFLEHTIPASSDGLQPERHYGRLELQLMVDWANYRIRNSDTFSVISAGHTPTPDEIAAGRAMPDVLGYAGPFYLGQLGDVDPRWAIYVDEWIHLADVARFEKCQRRSPEVWVSEPIEQRTMDPIAALGAETPRLDCGMNPYCRAGDGQTVMSYSAMSFRMADANSGVQGHRPSRVAKHPSKAAVLTSPIPKNFDRSRFCLMTSRVLSRRFSANPLEGELTMPLSSVSLPRIHTPEGVDATLLQQAVLQAVTSLLPDVIRTVLQQLSNADDGEEVEAEDLNAGDDGDLHPDSADRAFDEVEELALQELPGIVSEEDALMQPYSAMAPDCQLAFRAGWRQGNARSQRYSRTTDLHKVVARQQVRLQELSDQIARERRETARYSKLNELSREFAFDPREEAETCRDMSDKQFERHCTATIVKYARRDDVTNVELFTDPTVRADSFGGTGTRVNVEQIERYSREAAAIAARKNAVRRGSTTFEAEFESLCKQHGISV